MFHDPEDPDFHPIRRMLQIPLLHYTRRLLLISVMYGGIILLLLWLPIQTVIRALPGIIPYRVALRHPIELMLLNLAIPFFSVGPGLGLSLIVLHPNSIEGSHATQERWNPAGPLKKIIRAWFGAVGTALGMRNYFLTPEGPNAIHIEQVGNANVPVGLMVPRPQDPPSLSPSSNHRMPACIHCLRCECARCLSPAGGRCFLLCCGCWSCLW